MSFCEDSEEIQEKVMAQHFRDEETARRIEALGPSRVRPEVSGFEKTLGRGGKRPEESCPACGKKKTRLEKFKEEAAEFKRERIDRLTR